MFLSNALPKLEKKINFILQPYISYKLPLICYSHVRESNNTDVTITAFFNNSCSTQQNDFIVIRIKAKHYLSRYAIYRIHSLSTPTGKELVIDVIYL